MTDREKQRQRLPESSGRDHKRRQHQPQRDGEDDSGERDSLVPDRIVAKELGTSVMSLWRWSHDPTDSFPPPVKIHGRNFRSRKQLEAYKKRVMKEALRVHRGRLNLRRRVPLPVS